MNSLINFIGQDQISKYHFKIIPDPIPSFCKSITGEIVLVYENGELIDIKLPFKTDKLDKEKMYLLTEVQKIIKMISDGKSLNVLVDRKHDLFKCTKNYTEKVKMKHTPEEYKPLIDFFAENNNLVHWINRIPNNLEELLSDACDDKIVTSYLGTQTYAITNYEYLKENGYDEYAFD